MSIQSFAWLGQGFVFFDVMGSNQNLKEKIQNYSLSHPLFHKKITVDQNCGAHCLNKFNFKKIVSILTFHQVKEGVKKHERHDTA